ncbi:MAG: hypothetical protein JXQ75_24050 [Phycisphaerae bacterium]|nr:hypothetical protein [Phycisphaerae bacterium]
MSTESSGVAAKDRPLAGWLGIFVVVVLLGTAGYLTYKTLTTAGPPTPEPVEAVFMCAETGKTFPYAMQKGEHWPVMSPYSNKQTGYPTEQCYWTKVGREWRRKKTPTYVILNEYLGKPGDTVCPDCGRIVVGHNPLPPLEVPLVDETPATAPAP